MSRAEGIAIERGRVVITDAMVERGASALATGASYNPNDVDAGAWPHIRDDFRAKARAILEAALWAASPEGEGS